MTGVYITELLKSSLIDQQLPKKPNSLRIQRAAREALLSFHSKSSMECTTVIATRKLGDAQVEKSTNLVGVGIGVAWGRQGPSEQARAP